VFALAALAWAEQTASTVFAWAALALAEQTASIAPALAASVCAEPDLSVIAGARLGAPALAGVESECVLPALAWPASNARVLARSVSLAACLYAPET